MMEQEWTIGGRNCLLIWMLGSDERNDVAGMAEMIAAACDVPFVLAACFVDDWERDLTPWADPFLDLMTIPPCAVDSMTENSTIRE